MKRQFLSIFAGCSLGMFLYMAAVGNFPRTIEGIFKAAALTFFLSGSGAAAGTLALSTSSLKKSEIQISEKGNIDKMLLSKVNSLIESGAVSPDTGIEIQEAIAHEASEQLMREAKIAYPPVI